MLQQGDKLIVAPNNAMISFHFSSGDVVTIREVFNNGYPISVALEGDEPGVVWALGNFIVNPYDQSNFRTSYLRKGDVCTFVDGSIKTLMFTPGNDEVDYYDNLEHKIWDTTDRDIYKVEREGVTLFKRSENLLVF